MIKVKTKGAVSPLYRSSIAGNFRTSTVVARRRQIELDDVAESFHSERTDTLLRRLSHYWTRERISPRPSLSKPICKLFWKDFLLAGLFGFISQLSFCVSFLMMAFLIDELVDTEAGSDSRDRGLIYAACFSVAITVMLVFMHQSDFKGSVGFMKMRKVLTAVTEGKIINSASSDLAILDYGQYPLVHLFFEPFAIPVFVIFTWQLVGVDVLWGFTVAVVVMLTTPLCGKCSNILRTKATHLTDQRLKLLYDSISGVRTIKAYALEKTIEVSWIANNQERIKKVRKKEIREIMWGNILKNTNRTGSIFSAYIATSIVYIVKTARNETLSPGEAFALLAAFTVIYYNSIMTLSQALIYSSELRATFKKIVDILCLPQKGNTTFKKTFGQTRIEDVVVQCKDTTISWHPLDEEALLNSSIVGEAGGGQVSQFLGQSLFSLSKLNFTITQGQLLVIVGKVGTGKSSLLHALLQQNFSYPPLQNNLLKSKRLAYVEQEPFILSDTVKNNICFGLPYDEEKFKRISEAACLTQDFKQLAKAEHTLIGERGINLSGGQKVRVSLARALYSEAEIYLLDDPLSAVDQQVADRLIEYSIRGVLNDKTRIMVTHRLNLLEHANKILFLQEGSQKFFGSFQEFSEQNYDLAQIAQQVEGKKNEQEGFKENGLDQADNLSEQLDGEEENMNLIQDESTSKRLKCKDVTGFTKYSCGCFTLPFILFTAIIPALLNLWASEWVRRWMNESNQEQTNLYYPLMFGLFSILLILTGVTRGITIIGLTLTQGRALHNHMLERLLRSPVGFFDSNPVGRILNRFSKDIGVVDLIIYDLTDAFIYLYMRVFTILILVCTVLPILLVVLVFFITILILVRCKAMRLTNATMQLELISRSPIATALGAALSGLPTIRAYAQQERFKSDFSFELERNGQAYFTFVALSRSLGFYLDFMCIIFSVVTVFISFFFRSDSNALSLALAIQLLSDNLNIFQFGTRLSSELENYMTSVTRCLQYSQLESEAPLYVKHQRNILHNWPAEGRVEFLNVTMRYREDLKPALNNLSVQIPAQAKVGVVGRTGAGKSSILQCLFRMRELDSNNGGQIIIDGIDIATLGLHQLRLALSIVPQTPFILQGSVRQNLLLFKEEEEIEDSELWNALDAVELREHIERLPGQLECNCSDANSVFSVGQKQLLSLARAILQKRKVLVFDEPTANVDMATDRIVQRVIREKFKSCTVITIAHRLDTVIDSDKVIVMGEGRLLEEGSPFELLTERETDTEITRDGAFAKIVKSTKGEAQTLFEKAREQYRKNKED